MDQGAVMEWDQNAKPPGTTTPSSAGGRRCPTCGKPTVDAFQPFCSKRCADVDLNRWLSGAYAIPGEPVDLDTPDLARRDDGKTPEEE